MPAKNYYKVSIKLHLRNSVITDGSEVNYLMDSLKEAITKILTSEQAKHFGSHYECDYQLEMEDISDRARPFEAPFMLGQPPKMGRIE